MRLCLPVNGQIQVLELSNIRWPFRRALQYAFYDWGGLMNGMLTSEFVRKTQIETDLIAAQQIQQTLHPEKLFAPALYPCA